MRKLSRHIFLLFVISVLSTSCVYYNTFYNAETSFDKANELIEESAQLESGDIPSQAGNLLEKSIENSFIVIEKYPESKYVDDAIYLIGRSTLLLNDIAMSERYLSKLVKEYPSSEFAFEAHIWLSYVHFKMGQSELAKQELDDVLKSKPKRKEDKFLIHSILAEIALDLKDNETAFIEYETCIRYASTDSKKFKIYSILANLAEKNKLYEKLVGYLENVERYTSKSDIRRSTKLDWIDVNRKLQNYDIIIEEIEKLLGLSEYSSIKIKLELERGKVYLDMGDFETAQGFFETLVEEYTKKNETAEAYYHLGTIQLLENFNLSLASDLFVKSKEEKPRSEYGKKSNDAKELIEDYTILVEDYRYLTEEQPAIEDSVFILEEILDSTFIDNEMVMSPPVPQMSGNETNPDSLLFRMGQILYFDFFQEDSAMEKYIHLVNEYPYSKFIPQSLYILHQHFPNQNWAEKLETEYPESTYLQRSENDTLNETAHNVDPLIAKRDSAWDLQIDSYIAVKEKFLQIAEEENDPISLYSAGLVADIYLNNLQDAVKIYRRLVTQYPEHEQSIIANDRMNEISSIIETELHKIDQKKLFYDALSLIKHDFLLDSAKVVLNQVKSGENTSIKSTASTLSQNIDIYNQIESKIQSILADTTLAIADTNTSQISEYNELDSLNYKKANLFKTNFVIKDSAKSIFNFIIDEYSVSTFRPYSMLHMAELDSTFDWIKLLHDEYPDTSFYLDSTIVISPLLSLDINSILYNELDEQYQNINAFSTVFDTVKEDIPIPIADTLGVGLTNLYFSNTEYPWEAVYSWNFVSKSDSSKQTVFEVLNLFTEHEIFGQTNSSSEYIVVEGDNLGVIAEKIYNNPDAWTVLVMDNEDYLSQTNGKVSTGMKLKIRYEFKENE